MSDWSDFGVGPQSDGTYSVPATAVPSNMPWDTGGGVLGGYGAQAMDILKYGVGLAAKSYDNRQLLDYKRYEATQGGAFQQGLPAFYAGAPMARSMMPILMIGGAVVLAVLMLKR